MTFEKQPPQVHTSHCLLTRHSLQHTRPLTNELDRKAVGAHIAFMTAQQAGTLSIAW